MAPIPGYFPGMGPIRGFVAPEPEAPPEVVHGGPVNPFHGQWGETAQPYSWQSQLTNFSGHSGPYGLENALLGDEDVIEGEPAGQLGHDPYGDLVPYRGHAAPMTVTLSGPLPSQYDAVNQELVQGAEIRSTDLGTSRKWTTTELGDAQQDSWQEIWDVSIEPEKYPAGSDPSRGSNLFGFGNNDRTVNGLRKLNLFGFGDGHHHRRIATGSVPGNYMWMKPGGRPLVKSLPGPARPAVGADSPFEGDDLGLSFGIQGAVLVNVPSEYQPPPSPQVAAPVNYDEPANPVPLW
jgi:hypothetical protein